MNANDRTAIACLAAAVFAVIVPPSLRAEDAAAAPTPAVPDQVVSNLLRDPFWPVGYWPKAKVADTNNQAVTQGDVAQPHPPPPHDDPPKWPNLRVKGTMRTSSGYVAVLEGIKGIVEVGQTVHKEEGIYAYSWKITAISATTLSHTRLGVRKIK